MQVRSTGLRIHMPDVYTLLFHGCILTALFLPDCVSLFAYSNSFVWPHDLTTLLFSCILPVPKRCTHVTKGQLLTIGTQELLELSGTLLHFVPNPCSEWDQC